MKKLAWVSLGWLLAIAGAVYGQVYGFFPTPGMTLTSGLPPLNITPASGTAIQTPTAGALLAVHQSTATASFIEDDAYANTANVVLRRADTSATSPSALANGESIGSFQVRGYNGSAYSTATGAFSCGTQQAWTNAAEGTFCGIYTTANGAIANSIQAAFGSAAAGSNFASVQIAAGTATLFPLQFNSGTLLTTPNAGGWEYDGVVSYFTPTASNRNVNLVEQFQVLSAAYTLTSQTAAQKLLNGTTNGTLTLPVGTFDFECQFALSSMSATSGSFGFALGGTATFTQNWFAQATMPSAQATATAPFLTYNTAANTNLTSSTTTANGNAVIQGNIRVTVAGTVIPEVSLTVAAAAVVATGSFCRVKPIGAQAVVSVGNWS